MNEEEKRKDRIKFVRRKIVPINTWIPWNPVNIKKDVPKVESLIQKKEFLYSLHWKNLNIIPKITVLSKKMLNNFFRP